ncbi:MAG: mechanosensitive ion channel family protein [Prevotella sp.]|nr:mechanosensitive ion channel family protein [Prevotella sp.]
MRLIQRLITLTLTLTITLTAGAVLKEDSLENTLQVLRVELEKYHDEYSEKQTIMKAAGQKVFKTLMETMQNSNQNALMLYSQRDGYVFDLTYACHEAIEQYHDFERKLIPFMEYVEQSDGEVARFDSLISCLKTMPVMMLTPKAKVDRNVCLALAVNTRRMVQEDHDQLKEYIMYYKMTEVRLKYLNDYANKKYSEIQNSIFVNGGDDYLMILSRLKFYLTQTKESINDKYFSNMRARSQWDSRWIFGLFMVIVFYGFIAVMLNQLIVRWLVTKLLKKGYGTEKIADWFMLKRKMVIMASTVITFAIILGILRATTDQNFLQMAANLLVQYSWLLGVVIISLLLRAKQESGIKTLMVYLPLLVNGFIVISFRIILIPNALVNLIFPPILLVCCLWQWYSLKKSRGMIDNGDRSFAYVSQLVFVTSLICSLVGYTLLSVQILIWWIMQLTCILTITCLRDWYRSYSKSKKLYEKPITKTWLHNAIYWVVLPICGVFSVVLSLYWAADVFNLSDLTMKLFTRRFIDTPNFSASIFSIAQVVSLWFVFAYINHTAKAFAKHALEQRDPMNAAQKFMMVKNVMQIFIWGMWFLIAMAMFHVSNTWLVVVSGGLSTGIGFASKDILENIYYGISLMAGRIKIGDLIVCDGVRGIVDSISYTSTMINTTDGSVIAFQNSQLFTKNYKNMTRNHGYELHVLDVGVAYGTDVKKAREVIKKAVMKLDVINKRKGVNVVLKELGDSALVLKITAWVNVFTQYSDDGVILEAVYDALNENNIEIPFPQTDVHIKTA